jgi:hypothetical protein
MAFILLKIEDLGEHKRKEEAKRSARITSGA